MVRINKKYSKNFKIKVVRKYLEGNTSLTEIAKEFQIASKTQVYEWVKKYKEKGEEAFEFEMRGNSSSKILSEEYSFDNLEEEIEFLRMENDYLRKLSEILKKKLREKNKIIIANNIS